MLSFLRQSRLALTGRPLAFVACRAIIWRQNGKIRGWARLGTLMEKATDELLG